MLKSFVVESTVDSNHPRFDTHDKRKQIATLLRTTPLPNTIIWMVRLPTEFSDGAFNRLSHVIYDNDGNSVQIYTGFVGRVVFQILKWMGRSFPADGARPKNIERILKTWKKRSVEIWPRHFGKTLPAVLSIEDAVRFRHRFDARFKVAVKPHNASRTA